ncbi:hypothetical protein VNO80_25327 [Phaseolus coccineus]|uniref:Uncharacterized protein n=1 Tax=Phaseolus coccineus TaxID=3886 RepID=A0AAN9QNW2_PHACN
MLGEGEGLGIYIKCAVGLKREKEGGVKEWDILNGSLRQFGEWGVNLVQGNEYTHTRHFLPFDAFVSVHPKSPPVPLPLVNQSNSLCACRDSLHSPTTTAPRVVCRTALFISCFAPHDPGGSTHARATRVTGRESE